MRMSYSLKGLRVSGRKVMKRAPIGAPQRE